MPIKKHIIKVEPENKITIPRSVCDALGISEGTSIRLQSNGNGYSFSCEVPLSFENICLLDKYKQENKELREEIAQLRKSQTKEN